MIEDLRTAAKNYNWENSKDELTKILIDLEVLRGANLCLEYFKLYYPKYRQINNSEDWLSIRLSEIQESVLFAEHGRALEPFPDMNIKYENPKLRTLKWAVFFFWSGARFHNDDHQRSSKFAEVMSRMITLLRLEHQKWYPNAFKQEILQELDSDAYGAYLWLRIADKLEQS